MTLIVNDRVVLEIINNAGVRVYNAQYGKLYTHYVHTIITSVKTPAKYEVSVFLHCTNRVPMPPPTFVFNVTNITWSMNERNNLLENRWQAFFCQWRKTLIPRRYLSLANTSSRCDPALKLSYFTVVFLPHVVDLYLPHLLNTLQLPSVTSILNYMSIHTTSISTSSLMS